MWVPRRRSMELSRAEQARLLHVRQFDPDELDQTPMPQRHPVALDLRDDNRDPAPRHRRVHFPELAEFGLHERANQGRSGGLQTRRSNSLVFSSTTLSISSRSVRQLVFSWCLGGAPTRSRCSCSIRARMIAKSSAARIVSSPALFESVNVGRGIWFE